MTNGYRRGYGPHASGFYSPYSKNIQWGQGISELLNNMMMMKQFRQAQEQQKWQRGITEQELELRRRRLEQPKEPTATERRWSMADTKVASGEWSKIQGDKYKMSGQLPEPKVKYPATTVANVKGMFKITDEEWKGLPTQQKGAYFKEFQLRTRPSAKKVLTPEEIATEKKFEWHKNLLEPTLRRLNKERDSIIKRLPDQYKQYPGILSESEKAFARHLKNVDDAIDFLGGAENWLASGRPLGKRMEDALKQLSRNMHRVRTGKTMEGIRASFIKEGEETISPRSGVIGGLIIGKTYEDKDGNKAIYRGIDAIGKAKWERVR